MGDELQKIMLLILALAIMLSSLSHGFTQAELTMVSVEPSSLTVPAFEVFSVDIAISTVGFDELYAWEVRVGFRNDTIELISAELPQGHFLEPTLDPLNCHIPIWRLREPSQGNETFQIARFAFTLLAPEPARRGTGILLRLEFFSKKIGETPIDLTDHIVSQVNIIWSEIRDGNVVVVPSVADLNEDGTVDVFDLVIVASSFGSDPSSSSEALKADINNDNIVDILDMATVAKYFGQPK